MQTKNIFDFVRNCDFNIETVKNETLKNILKDILNIKSLKEFHIQIINNRLYICLFDLSQLNRPIIEKILLKYDLIGETYVTDCNEAMSYLPTTEIEAEPELYFNEDLIIYDY